MAFRGKASDSLLLEYFLGGDTDVEIDLRSVACQGLSELGLSLSPAELVTHAMSRSRHTAPAARRGAVGAN